MRKDEIKKGNQHWIAHRQLNKEADHFALHYPNNPVLREQINAPKSRVKR